LREKYFLRKVRKGRSEPVYERFVMKTSRIPKLRRESHASTHSDGCRLRRVKMRASFE